MLLRDVRTSLARRWYLVVVGLAVTAFACVGAARAVPATFEAEANLVLLPPASTVEPDGNPYLYLGGLGQAVELLARSVSSNEVTEKVLGGAPVGTSYAVAPDPTASGPILLITAEAHSSEASLATLQSVLEAVPANLDELQADLDVPVPSRITSMPLVVDDRSLPVRKAQVRALVAAAVVGTVGTVLGVGFVDGLLLSRRRRVTVREEQAPDGGTGATGTDSGSRQLYGPQHTALGADDLPRRERALRTVKR